MPVRVSRERFTTSSSWNGCAAMIAAPATWAVSMPRWRHSSDRATDRLRERRDRWPSSSATGVDLPMRGSAHESADARGDRSPRRAGRRHGGAAQTETRCRELAARFARTYDRRADRERTGAGRADALRPAGERTRRRALDTDLARDQRDPPLLPHERDADLVRLGDAVQPARDRSLGSQLHVPQLLRLFRRCSSERVRAHPCRTADIRVDRGDLQLPARAQGGHRPRSRRRPRQGRVPDVR